MKQEGGGWFLVESNEMVASWGNRETTGRVRRKESMSPSEKPADALR